MTDRPDEPLKVLVVDDDDEMRRFLADGLRRRAFVVDVAADAAAAKAVVDSGVDVDVVLTDVRMRGEDGLALARALHERRPDVPVVVMTGFGSVDVVVDALRAGAVDFVQKPVTLEVMVHVLRRAGAERRTARALAALRERVAVADDAFGLLGASPGMVRLREQCAELARVPSTVLIGGESGTGKERVARALHDGGPRKDGPFVAVNVSALPETLLESQLFGHVRGAFTDAKEARAGLFAQARGGTLFLDEIGDLPLPLQPKLLRVLQERRFRPLGADAEVAFDGRVVCATHKDLERAVADGGFREDLFYRVNVIAIDVPPLRSRGDDVLLLADHFLAQHAARGGRRRRLSAAVAAVLLRWQWPGNVRELENAMERAATLGKGDEVDVADLPPRLLQTLTRLSPAASSSTASSSTSSSTSPSATPSTSSMSSMSSPSTTHKPLAQVEREHILAVFGACDENRQKTAQALGIARRTLYRKLQEYGVGGDVDDPADPADDG
jgi:DNA-binding NtrC family response regulator